jgi:hypothetical protein
MQAVMPDITELLSLLSLLSLLRRQPAPKASGDFKSALGAVDGVASGWEMVF